MNLDASLRRPTGSSCEVCEDLNFNWKLTGSSTDERQVGGIAVRHVQALLNSNNLLASLAPGEAQLATLGLVVHILVAGSCLALGYARQLQRQAHARVSLKASELHAKLDT